MGSCVNPALPTAAATSVPGARGALPAYGSPVDWNGGVRSLAHVEDWRTAGPRPLKRLAVGAALFAMLPAVLVVLVSAAAVAPALRRHAESDLATLAQVVAERVAHAIDTADTVLVALGDVGEVRGAAGGACDARLAAAARRREAFSVVFRIDRDGLVRCASMPLTRRIDVTGSPGLDEVWRTRDRHVQPSFVGRVSGLPVMVVTRWFSDGAGGPGFLLSVGVRLDRLDDVLLDSGLPTGSRLRLTRVGSPDAFEAAVGGAAAPRLLEASAAVPGSGGADVVSVGLPEDALLADGLWLLGFHALTLLAAAAATTVAAGYVVQRHVVGHLGRLHAHAVGSSADADVAGAPLEIVALADAVARKEQDLRDAQAAGGVVTWWHSPERGLDLSASFEDVVGRPRPDTLEGLLSMLEPGDAERLAGALGSPGTEGWRIEVRTAAADDGSRVLVVDAAPADRAGGPRVGTLKDVTRERALERRLRDATSRAEAASNAKSAFLAMMSHELRTPLNAVCGFSDLIAEETFGPVGNDRYREYVGDIRDSARHLVGVIDQVLDIARVEAGRTEPSLEPLDADELLGAAARMLGETARERGGGMVHEPSPGLVLHADRRMLLQCLVNLAGNALRHGPGGRTVRLRAEAVEGLGARLLVEDDGPGVPLPVLHGAMSPFGLDPELVRDATRRIGFGLQITRGLAAAHGGHLLISPHRADGTGTRAGVLLPPERVLEAGTAPTLAAASLFDEAEPGGGPADLLASGRFGVVLLDAAGRVLACNALERRFAGLGGEDPSGRDFLRDVAPCTAHTQLPSRFARVARGDAEDEILPCTFRLTRAGARVLIRLSRVPAEDVIVMRVRWF
jgi:signal transduction histidine kinase